MRSTLRQIEVHMDHRRRPVGPHEKAWLALRGRRRCAFDAFFDGSVLFLFKFGPKERDQKRARAPTHP